MVHLPEGKNHPDKSELPTEPRRVQPTVDGLLKAVVENLSEGVLFIDNDEIILYNNPAAIAILHAGQPLLGLSLSSFFAEEPYNDFHRQFLHQEPGEEFQWIFILRQENEPDRRISLRVMTWPEKAPINFRILWINEVTQPDALAFENDQANGFSYRTIVEDQTDQIFRFLPNGTITYANEAYCRYWEKERSTVVGTSMMACIPREERHVIRAQFTSLTVACPAITYETKVMFPDATFRWQQRTDRAVFDEQKHPIEYISVGHDITERKTAELALKHQLAMEDIVMNISSRFISVIPVEIDKEIDRSLRLLGEFLEVDHCFIEIIESPQKKISQSYEWSSAHAKPAFRWRCENEIRHFQWALTRLSNLEMVQLHNLNDLSADAEIVKDHWKSAGIRSFLALPLAQGSQFLGFFGFDSEQREKKWLEEEIGLLKMIGGIFVSVLIRKQSVLTLQETQTQLNQRILELEERAREINLLTEMSNMLQIASQFEETYIIVADYSAQLFPEMSGMLWIMDPSMNNLQIKNKWGQIIASTNNLTSEDCWALRRGRQYLITNETPNLFCHHIGNPRPSSSLCIPIMMQGKTVGLLHLQTPQGSPPISSATQQLVAVTAEQIGLALSNLQLRQDLREQAIRDPLTGLYNRYYMEISLERELNRAARSLSPVSMMLLDIDHFHLINEQFGHTAGDEILSELGRIMRSSIRAEDIACRFGGEEFMLILPDTPVEIALQRAEHLREDIRVSAVWHEGKPLPSITLTISLVCWPQHARNVYEMIRKAETSMHLAKQTERNRVWVAD